MRSRRSRKDLSGYALAGSYNGNVKNLEHKSQSPDRGGQPRKKTTATLSHP
jgi:hypothetical protein